MATGLELELDVARLYRATAVPQLVDVPEFAFLMIDGHGDPNTSRHYAESIQALFTLSYSLKFAIKRASGANYKVAPLEGLWWAADMASFEDADKSSWYWTALIRQPAPVTADLFTQMLEEVTRKKQLPAVPRRSARKLHRGTVGADHACRSVLR